MRTLSLFCLLFLAAIVAHGQTFEYKGPDGQKLRYELCSKGKAARVLPRADIKDFRSFKNYSYESIAIPDEVIYKGGHFPVEEIGQHAFYNCKLRNITFPPSIKGIRGDAFSSFHTDRVTLSDLAAWCQAWHMTSYSYHDNLFSETTALYLKDKQVTQLVIPRNVRTIQNRAFECCNIESVDLSQAFVESIGYKAFASCKNLKEVKLANGLLKSIGAYAFNRCKALQHIDIPATVTVIGDCAFEYSGITSVDIPNSVTDIGKRAFKSCYLTTAKLPATVKKIGEQTFQNCAQLRDVQIACDIPERAFEGCKALKKVVIKKPDANIGINAFKGCTALTTVQGLNESTRFATTTFDDCPFSISEQMKTFSYYYPAKLRKAIAEWQKRGEFETSEQWRNRVTEANRDAKAKMVMEELKLAYLEQQRKAEPQPQLMVYDADKSTFPIRIGAETIYVRVPNDEAPQFKEGFKAEFVQTQYDIVNDRLAIVGRTCKVGDRIYEVANTYAKADNLSELALNLPPLEIDFGTPTQAKTEEKATAIDRTIDLNIPSTGAKDEKTFAVIIGNENYTQVSKVPFAKNDAQVVAEYCRKTLGLPAKNVRTYGDATYAMMMNAVRDIQDIAKAYQGDINVIFYYAGHGVPNESSRDAYLLPIDADGRQTDICYPVSRLYKELGALGAHRVVVFMDACFSGAQRGEGMLASARGVALKAKASAPQGNMVVFSAATGDETAFPFKEKGHGMFTYFLLKKLQESKGDCTLGELGDYIQTNVRQQSVVVNRKNQTPTIVPSGTMIEKWKNLKLR